MSNQHFSTENLPPAGNDVIAGDTFSYAINSFYKAHGRSIDVGYFDGDSLVSFGSVDANPIIFEQNKSREFRCLLNVDKQK